MKKRNNYQSHLPCIACGKIGEGQIVLHHVKTRGSGGKDDSWNLLSLCQIPHHNEIHQIGLTVFAKKYPMVDEWLTYNGWTYDYFLEKWIHENQEKLCT